MRKGQFSLLSKTVTFLLGSAFVLLFFSYCSQPSPNGNNGNNGQTTPINPAKYGLSSLCPGAAGCMDNKGELLVGAAAVDISPKGYEVARFSYLNEDGFCPKPTPISPFNRKRCGALVRRGMYSRGDCGHDGICPGDKIRTRTSCDKDGKCPDGLICHKDKRCYIHYPGPDKNGSEKDGQPDWFLDCGRDHICPCIAKDGTQSYYKPDKKTCFDGYSKNPKYKGPDADGSEGNGKFEGFWMAGFEGNHPLQGYHDSIWARALVFSTGKTTVAIVSVDLVGYFRNRIEEARKKVLAQLPKDAIDYILISATHTHEAPDVIGQWGQYQSGVPKASGVNPAYTESIVQNIVKAILTAHKNMKKATIKVAQIGTGREGFLRDSRDPKIFDDTLSVLQITEKDSQTPICTLVNWGNHPESLSDTNNYLTSDFAHYLREGIEKGLPKTAKTPEYKGHGGVAIFLQGAVGGLMTPLRVTVPDLDGTPQHHSNWDKARALGYQLARKAFEALKKGEVLKSPQLSLWVKHTELPVENKAFQMGFSLGLFDRQPFGFDKDSPISEDNMPKIRTEIALIRLGDITFFSMPGELDPQILVGGYDGSHSFGLDLIDKDNPNPPDLSKAPKGPYLKEKIPGKYKLFVGLANDFLGYILPSWNYKLHKTLPYFKRAKGDHYGETNSLGPTIAPTLLKLYDELIPIVKKTSSPKK